MPGMEILGLRLAMSDNPDDGVFKTEESSAGLSGAYERSDKYITRRKTAISETTPGPSPRRRSLSENATYRPLSGGPPTDGDCFRSGVSMPCRLLDQV